MKTHFPISLSLLAVNSRLSPSQRQLSLIMRLVSRRGGASRPVPQNKVTFVVMAIFVSVTSIDTYVLWNVVLGEKSSKIKKEADL